MSLHVNQSGIWTPVNKLHVHSGGAFVPVKKAFVNQGGTWHEYFTEESGPPGIPTDATHQYEMEEKQGDFVKNEVTGDYDGNAAPLEISSGGLYGNCLTNTGGSLEPFESYLDSGNLRTIVAWINLSTTDDFDHLRGMVDPYDRAFNLSKSSDDLFNYSAYIDGTSVISDSLGYDISGSFDFLAVRIPEGVLEHYVNINGVKHTIILTEETDLPAGIVARIGNGGFLDQVWGFDRALTDEEIAALYNNGAGVPFP